MKYSHLRRRTSYHQQQPRHRRGLQFPLREHNSQDHQPHLTWHPRHPTGDFLSDYHHIVLYCKVPFPFFALFPLCLPFFVVKLTSKRQVKGRASSTIQDQGSSQYVAHVICQFVLHSFPQSSYQAGPKDRQAPSLDIDVTASSISPLVDECEQGEYSPCSTRRLGS